MITRRQVQKIQMRNVRFLITLLMSIKCVIPYRQEKILDIFPDINSMHF